MRNGMTRLAALNALLEVGATDVEADAVIEDPDLLNEMTTWPEHRIWARMALIRLRARVAEEMKD